jgi:hypothetical protein
MVDHQRSTVFPAYRCKLQYTFIDALISSEIRCREEKNPGAPGASAFYRLLGIMLEPSGQLLWHPEAGPN